MSDQIDDDVASGPVSVALQSLADEVRTLRRIVEDHVADEQTNLQAIADWVRAGKLAGKIFAIAAGTVVAFAGAWTWLHDHFVVTPK